MGLEDNEPPKKKLKQAQLPFCNQYVKGNKNKCNDVINEHKQPFKIIPPEEVDRAKGTIAVIENSAEAIDSTNDVCETSANDVFVSPNSKLKSSKHLLITDITEKCGFKNNDSKPASLCEPASIDDSKECLGDNIGNIVEDIVNNSESLVKIGDTNSACYDKLTVIDIDDSVEEMVEETQGIVKSVEPSTFTGSSDVEKYEENKSTKVQTSPSNSPANVLKRKLTPKSSVEKKKDGENSKQGKLNQRERDKEEKLKIKMERENHKRKEKEEKEKKKLADQKQKEEERRRKEEIKEEEKRLKEEERRRKEEAKEEERRKKEEAKEEEKRLKEEERRKKEEAREEEKRLKEEEKRRKEEVREEEKRKKEEAKLSEQRKENQAREAFTNFFIQKKSKTDNMDTMEVNTQPKFMPFQVKPDMRVAVESRRNLSSEEKRKLEAYFDGDLQEDTLYLKQLKNGIHVPLRAESTWPLSEEQHDVIIIESIVDGEMVDGSPEKKKTKRNFKKAKLLQFHENRRPAYWGTWRKQSGTVSPKQPFLKDDNLNYEVDSDSEWEDEGEGEDIGDEGDSDKEHSDEEIGDEKDENGYILDNTFVPHGYLSDEEVQPDEEHFDPEDQKLRLKALKKEFDEEMNMKTERLKPRLLGCVWISNDTAAVSKGSLYEVLMNYRASWDEDCGPIKVIGPPVVESPTLPLAKSKAIPQTVMELLVKFIHGNHLPFLIMVQEFKNLMEKENYPLLSKRALSLKIKEMANKEVDENGKQLWSVNNELCTEYGLTPVSQMNSSAAEKSKDTLLDHFLKRPSTSPQHGCTKGASVIAKSSSVTKQNISNHLPICRPGEASPLPPPSTPPVASQGVKKRVTLISLPHTPTNDPKQTNKVHIDTPRPLHSFFKNAQPKDHSKSIKSDKDDVIEIMDD